MPNNELEQIINHIEAILNKPIIDVQIRQQKAKVELKKAEREIKKSASSASSKKKMQEQI